MLETISEWSTIYFKLGACLGFGIGALAQVVETKRDWTFFNCVIITCLWPVIILEVWTRSRKK